MESHSILTEKISKIVKYRIIKILNILENKLILTPNNLSLLINNLIISYGSILYILIITQLR